MLSVSARSVSSPRANNSFRHMKPNNTRTLTKICNKKKPSHVPKHTRSPKNYKNAQVHRK